MINLKATNISWHEGAITQTDRERLLGKKELYYGLPDFRDQENVL